MGSADRPPDTPPCWVTCWPRGKKSEFLLNFFQLPCFKGHKNFEAMCFCFGYQSHKIPQCTCPISHNAPFRTEMCTFLFWMVHCGIWDRCIVGCVNLIYWWKLCLCLFLQLMQKITKKNNPEWYFCQGILCIFCKIALGWMSIILSQHWCRLWLDAVRQQAII